MDKLIQLRDWVDARLPIMRAWDTHMGGYYAPKNFNFWYFFGVWVFTGESVGCFVVPGVL